MKELRTAVIGCGMISKNHLKALRQIDQVNCVAVCDLEEEKAQKAAAEYGIPRIYTDYKEMLNCPDLDAVHVCTPHHLHGQMVIDALKAGKHVLCEKPMALTAEDARKMTRAWRESGKQLGICFQNRYNATSVYMKEMLESGKLGKVIGGRGQVTWDRKPEYYQNAPWRGRWATEGGGVLINQAIHTFDLLQWLTVPVKTVEASIATRKLKQIIEVEDTAEIYMTGENEERLLFYASNCYVKNAPVELEIICQNGRIKLVGNQVTVEEGGKVWTMDDSSGTILGKDYWGSGHGILIDDFYRCIRTGEQFPVGPEEAMAVVELMEAVYRSARERIPVEISRKKEGDANEKEKDR